ATLADRVSALSPSRAEHARRLRSLEANHVARRHEQSTVSVVTPIDPVRGPADELVPVTGHPPLQPGVTRVLLRGRPDTGPVRAPVSADADQVQGLHALAGLTRGGVLEQYEAGPVSASQAGPDPPGRFSDGGDAASL